MHFEEKKHDKADLELDLLQSLADQRVNFSTCTSFLPSFQSVLVLILP